MKRLISYRTVLFFSLIIMFSQVQGLHAQWSTDPNENNCITNAPKDQKDNCIINDGMGNLIIGWRDLQFTSNVMLGGEIYAQKIDTSGALQWIEDGFVISENDHGQDYPVVISDGKGGAIFAWVDTIMGSQYGLHAQRINKSGSLAWGTNGILICSSTVWSAPAMVTDGKGGAIIAWIDTRGEDNDIYAQRIDSSGVKEWGENGMVVTNASGTQTDLAAISDGDGGIE